MRLELLTEDKDVNGILKQKLVKVKKPKTKLSILKEMVRVMIECKGIGLTANQVGLTDKMFVQYINTNTPKQKIIYVINPEFPKVIDARIQTFEERCLSYPNRKVMVERPYGIEVKYHNGKELVTRKLYGLDARIFYHEMQHIKGKCIVGEEVVGKESK